MRGSEFVSNRIDLLYYHLQKISLKRGRSYIDSPKWLKNKKATIKSKNNDNCFQYALIVTLNYQNIKNNPEKISKIKPFIDLYNWKEVDFPSEQKDWKKYELNNKSIALKDTYSEKASSDKTPPLRKSTNTGVWAVGTLNQLFVRGS